MSTQDPLAALWPAPAELHRSWSPRGRGTGYLALPDPGRPRLLVPTAVPGAGRTLTRHGGGRATRALRLALRQAHRTGAARLLPLPRLWVRPDPDGIEQHLATVLEEPVEGVAVLLGPPRANLKPVVQVFGRGGRVLAFAKIGTTALTRGLLETEAAALRTLADADLTGVRVPTLVHHGRWRDLGVLVATPLPHAQTDREPVDLPIEALAAIATAAPVRSQRLAETPLASVLFEPDAETDPDRWHGVDVSPFATLRSALDPRAQTRLGCWHGDFGPWNAAVGEGELEVWDWERFETGVPIGLDAAHWRVQLAMRGPHEPDATWSAVCADVSRVLEATGGAREDAWLVSACYLLVIWARYRSDAAGEANVALRQRVTRLAALADAAVRPSP